MLLLLLTLQKFLHFMQRSGRQRDSQRDRPGDRQRDSQQDGETTQATPSWTLGQWDNAQLQCVCECVSIFGYLSKVATFDLFVAVAAAASLTLGITGGQALEKYADHVGSL